MHTGLAGDRGDSRDGGVGGRTLGLQRDESGGTGAHTHRGREPGGAAWGRLPGSPGLRLGQQLVQQAQGLLPAAGGRRGAGIAAGLLLCRRRPGLVSRAALRGCLSRARLAPVGAAPPPPRDPAAPAAAAAHGAHPAWSAQQRGRRGARTGLGRERGGRDGAGEQGGGTPGGLRRGVRWRDGRGWGVTGDGGTWGDEPEESWGWERWRGEARVIWGAGEDRGWWGRWGMLGGMGG